MGCGLPFPSYGPIFSEKLSKVSELFSEMKFSIDLGFLVCFRYILVVIGKIEKSSVRHSEACEREFSCFSLQILSEH